MVSNLTVRRSRIELPAGTMADKQAEIDRAEADLAQARDALGTLDAVAQVVQVRGFVTCTPEFTEQPGVIDGASDLFAAVFGERGAHPTVGHDEAH